MFVLKLDGVRGARKTAIIGPARLARYRWPKTTRILAEMAQAIGPAVFHVKRSINKRVRNCERQRLV